MNDPMTAIAADLIDRLSRIETKTDDLVSLVKGNGKPGLLTRVDNLESMNDIKSGASKVKTAVISVVITAMFALLTLLVSQINTHNNKIDAQRQADMVYLQKQDSRIGQLEINVAVILEGLRGAPGQRGKPGVQGAPGAKGDKGGIKLFAK